MIPRMNGCIENLIIFLLPLFFKELLLPLKFITAWPFLIQECDKRQTLIFGISIEKCVHCEK